MSTVRFGLLSAVFVCVATAVLAQAPENLVGTWLAEDIGGGGVVDRVQTKIEIGADGAIAGSGGCNRLAGEARIDGESISFGPLAATRMACPPAVMDQEHKFHQALDRARQWKLDAPRRKLLLLDADGKAVVTFSRVDRGAVLEIEIPGAGDIARSKAAYDCGPRKVEAEYINAGPVSLVALSINGEFVLASSVISGSGARYAGGPYIWWSKGEGATLEDRRQSASTTCTRAG